MKEIPFDPFDRLIFGDQIFFGDLLLYGDLIFYGELIFLVWIPNIFWKSNNFEDLIFLGTLILVDLFQISLLWDWNLGLIICKM